MKKSRQTSAAIIVFIFIMAIYSPFMGTFIQEDRTVSAAEKRELARFPSFPENAAMLKDFPAKLEEYYNDHFGMRELYIRTFAGIKRLIGDTEISSPGGESSAGNTIKGKNGWYFLNRVWDGDPISDYRNISLYSKTELLAATFTLAARKHWLNKHGIRYLLFFAPNKHTIYSEYMPDYLVKQGNVSSMDQLYGALKKYTSVAFVDLRPPLLDGKKDAHLYWKDNKEKATLYFKTDSHWNGAGANLAQFHIAKKIATMFPGVIKPELRNQQDFTMFKGPGDIASIMGRDDLDAYGPVLFTGRCAPATASDYEQREQVTTCSDGSLRALIFHDSFYPALKPFFADYFARTTFLWRNMTLPTVREQLQHGKIDLVIEEQAERFLPYIPDPHSPFHQDFWAQQWLHWDKVIFTLDGRKAASGNKKYSLSNLRLQYNGKEDSLTMHATTAKPGLVVTGIPFAADKLYMLHVEIESPASTRLQLYYATTDPAVPVPDQNNMASYSIKKGKNSLYIPLFSGNLGGTLKLDPGKIRGFYRLKELQIKEVDLSSLKNTK